MHDNDGRFPEDSAVEVRYPRNKAEEQGDRSAWPWLPGLVLEQCGPDEWQVLVQSPELATLEDGTVPPAGTPDDELCFPVCFRDSSELRRIPRREAADLIRELVAGGADLQQIANALNCEGIPAEDGTAWRASTVEHALLKVLRGGGELI